MKSISSFFGTPVLAICAVLIVTMSPTTYGSDVRSSHHSSEIVTTHAAHGGHLIIQRSPTLGHNVRIDVVIDGRLAGLLSRGRTFDTYIPPGHHLLIALPNGPDDEWYGTLDVRPGHTYHYIATYNVNRLVLNPVIEYRY
jgi:hypothetical protein